MGDVNPGRGRHYALPLFANGALSLSLSLSLSFENSLITRELAEKSRNQITSFGEEQVGSLHHIQEERGGVSRVCVRAYAKRK